MLARIGYHVVALTGKESEADYLRGLGAAEVFLRQNLDIGYVTRRNSLIQAVTLADAKRVAAKLLNTGDLLITVVGKPEAAAVNAQLGCHLA